MRMQRVLLLALKQDGESMSKELQKFIDEQFDALRKDVADAFSAARERLADAEEVARHASQIQKD